MLMPKKVKHRKWNKGRQRSRKEIRGTVLAFGAYGLKAEGKVWLTARQIEAARRAIIRHVRKGGKMWVRVFPDKPVTKKGTEVPMGGGKGATDHYVFPVLPGRILFEIDGISEDIAREALRLAAHKLPIPARFISREA